MEHTVLIVDDEPRITAALMIRLESRGYKVCHAINGLAGVEAACLCKPDVVVLDIRMPDIDGYETCSRIRRMPGMEKTPVIFLSANVQDSARAKAIAAGGSQFLSKPYDADDVIGAIEESLMAAGRAGGAQEVLR